MDDNNRKIDNTRRIEEQDYDMYNDYDEEELIDFGDEEDIEEDSDNDLDFDEDYDGYEEYSEDDWDEEPDTFAEGYEEDEGIEDENGEVLERNSQFTGNIEDDYDEGEVDFDEDYDEYESEDYEEEEKDEYETEEPAIKEYEDEEPESEEQYSETPDGEDELVDFGDVDDFGVTVDLAESGLKDDDSLDEFNIIGRDDSSFISNTGDIVVQDRNDTGDNFKLKYIDIQNIAVVGRIRASKNVDSLVQSIKSTGLLEPLIVAPLETKGFYVLIHGYRRIIACAKSGITSIPCVINNKISTTDIPILEALYNHSKKYSIKETIAYIEYLEKEKGILSASMIEYLLQMPSGDYTKLKDILSDDDDDIVSALLNEQLTISQAFKKLEQRRKKESKEEQEMKQTAKVYVDGEDNTVDKIAGSGEEGDDSSILSDEEIANLSISAADLKDIEDRDLDEMVEESKKMDGFEPNKQDYRNREILDPALRKAVLVRDDNTCQCCGLTGQEYTEVFDIHHIVEVYLGGSDDIDNLITTCVICHKLIHLGARGELFIRPSDEMTEEEKTKFKKILALSNVIRRGMAQKNMKKEELKKLDKAETIGRTKPGTARQVAT